MPASGHHKIWREKPEGCMQWGLHRLADRSAIASRKVGLAKSTSALAVRLLFGAMQALPPAERALRGHGDGVPTGFRHPRGLAALAAWCIACVSAAATAIPLAWEIVPQDVLAANIIPAHTDVAAAAIAMGALELVAVAVRALHRCRSALSVFADG